MKASRLLWMCAIAVCLALAGCTQAGPNCECAWQKMLMGCTADDSCWDAAMAARPDNSCWNAVMAMQSPPCPLHEAVMAARPDSTCWYAVMEMRQAPCPQEKLSAERAVSACP